MNDEMVKCGKQRDALPDGGQTATGGNAVRRGAKVLKRPVCVDGLSSFTAECLSMKIRPVMGERLRSPAAAQVRKASRCIGLSKVRRSAVENGGWVRDSEAEALKKMIDRRLSGIRNQVSSQLLGVIE